MRENLANEDDIFKALSDATRRRILQIVSRNELSVSDLVTCLALPQSTVSRHLKTLRAAELISDRREGTTVLYSLRTAINCDAQVIDGETQEVSVAVRVMEWLADETLPSAIDRRLENLLAARRNGSDDFFARVADRWDQMRLDAFGPAFHLEAMLSLLPHDRTVADIGAGAGYMLPALARHFRKVIAIDPVPEMLDIAQKRCTAEDLTNVIFRLGDLSDLPMRTRQVDIAIAVLVLHHVPNVENGLAEIHRIMRDGGQLLIVEQSPHTMMDFHERMQDLRTGFDRLALSKMLKRAGFADIRVSTIGSTNDRTGQADAPELFAVSARATANDANQRTSHPVRYTGKRHASAGDAATRNAGKRKQSNTG